MPNVPRHITETFQEVLKAGLFCSRHGAGKYQGSRLLSDGKYYYPASIACASLRRQKTFFVEGKVLLQATPARFPAPGPRLIGAGGEFGRLPTGKRVGRHSPPAVGDGDEGDAAEGPVCYIGGWKSPMPVLTCYHQPDTETQREGLAKRNRYRAGAGG